MQRRSSFRPRRGTSALKKRMTVAFFLLCLILLLMYGLLLTVERNVEPVLMTLADTRMKQVAADAIREALRRQVVSQDDFEGLIEFIRDDNGKVQGVVIDQQKQAALQEHTLTQIQDYMKDGMYEHMQEHGLDKMNIYLGQVFKSRLFADKGPSIPVTLIPKGAVAVDLNPTVETAGINMVLVNLMLKVKLEVSLVVPFPTKSVTVRTQFPIATAVVVGDTPQWYWNNGASSSTPPVFPGMAPDGRSTND